MDGGSYMFCISSARHNHWFDMETTIPRYPNEGLFEYAVSLLKILSSYVIVAQMRIKKKLILNISCWSPRKLDLGRYGQTSIKNWSNTNYLSDDQSFHVAMSFALSVCNTFLQKSCMDVMQVLDFRFYKSLEPTKIADAEHYTVLMQ